MSPVFECMDLEKFYFHGKNQVHALKKVTMKIDSGKLVCISGRSGSGKTTLLNCLGTLESFSGGKVSLNGISLEGLSERGLFKLRREHLGFIFQQPHLFPYLSVIDNVALPLVFRGSSWRRAREKAGLCLQGVDLESRSRHLARTLSGGEATRAAIARALVYDPPILLADEPTGELDNITSSRIVDLLAAQTNHGRTVVIASHDPVIEHRADLVFHLEDGRIV